MLFFLELKSLIFNVFLQREFLLKNFDEALPKMDIPSEPNFWLLFILERCRKRNKHHILLLSVKKPTESTYQNNLLFASGQHLQDWEYILETNLGDLAIHTQ